MNAISTITSGHGFTPKQVAILSDVLDVTLVKKRQQAGQTLSYIEAWRVIDQANQIFGFDGWTRETTRLDKTVHETYPKTKFDEGSRKKVSVRGPDGEPVMMTRVGYLAQVRVTVFTEDGAVVRDGTGYGSGTAEDPNMAFEGAVKEAESDAMKRALMTFGNPFGLALYDKAQESVGTPEYVATAEMEKAQKAAAPLLAAIEASKDEASLKVAFTAAYKRFGEFPESVQKLLTERKDEVKAAITKGEPVRGSLASPFGTAA